jgi:DNA polymerase III delta prime subunit
MTPWVEKYRPTTFQTIVMDEKTKQLFQTMLDKKYIPNLLLYGSPGTGKTTTVINLINDYQEMTGERNKGLMIHLNASDERGIDVIRSQIKTFVASKTFFGGGTKFVVLDEIDYMTKPAQQALRHMMQECALSARFCIICNYISKLDSSLQDSFVKIHFTSLPSHHVVAFLKTIASNEGMELSDAQARAVHRLFGSDLRSMINYLQTNQGNLLVLGDEVWEGLYAAVERETVEDLCRRVRVIEETYSIEPLSLIKDFLYYGVLKEKFALGKMAMLEAAIHNARAESADVVPFALAALRTDSRCLART